MTSTYPVGTSLVVSPHRYHGSDGTITRVSRQKCEGERCEDEMVQYDVRFGDEPRVWWMTHQQVRAAVQAEVRI